jgi:hypothetical protein
MVGLFQARYHMQNEFSIGQRVAAKAFTDCFGKAIPAVPHLTVTEVRRISCNHIPDYNLISTVYPNGFTAVIASARFFESEAL